MRNLIRKWLGIEETDRVLAKKILADKQSRRLQYIEVLPLEEHNKIMKGYNG